jgi:hypothetical protein
MARTTLVLLAGLLLALPVTSQAPDGGGKRDGPEAARAPAGTWKVTLPMVRGDPRSGLPLRWLVKLEKKDGKWSGSVLAAGAGAPKATLERLSVGKDEVRFVLKPAGRTIPCVVRLPGKPDAARMYGTARVGNLFPLEMDRTSLTTLDSFELAKERLARAPLGYEAVTLALSLLEQAAEKKVKPAEVRSWADKAIRSAELYGPGWQRMVLLAVAQTLSDEKGFEKVALPYAQRAERMLGPKERPGTQKQVLDTLAEVLERAGKADEAMRVRARAKKLDFRIKPRPYAGRKGKSNRVVLVELFTGAQCLPCVAADLAFDALEKTYKPAEVVLLQYHLHIPRPDALTSPAAEARAKLYGDDADATPSILFDGKAGAPGGGSNTEAVEKYEEYCEAIDPLLEMPAGAVLAVRASRKGNKVEISAEVADLAQTGDKVRLRLALVEEQVAYKGSNGLAVHHHVVRSFPGGAEGVALKEKTAKKKFTIDLDELRKQLTTYLDEYGKKRPFPTKERPLELKKLAVVAFVQNDDTLEVLQAAQAEVKSE